MPSGRDYKINDLGATIAGYTDFVKRELGVCRTVGGATRFVQLHELSHVEHSEDALRVAKDHPELKHDWINAAEDARIQTILLQRVPDAHANFEMSDDARDKLNCTLPGLVAGYNAPPELCRIQRRLANPTVVRAMDKKLLPLMARLEAEGKLSPEAWTLPVAQAIGRIVRGDEGEGEGKDKPGEYRECAKSGDSSSGEAGAPSESGDPGDGKPESASARKKPAGKATSGAGHPCSHVLPETTEDGAEWAMPTVIEAPLTRQVIRAGVSTRRAVDAGMTLGDVTRMASDGQIFTTPRRAPGALQRGTILIDVSGSMSISDGEINDICKHLPFATVAVYSGAPAVLQIIARNGRVMSPYYKKGGNMNECDGPALLWLSRQTGPRIWVCDGLVTGRDDAPSSRLNTEAFAIARAARAMRVPHLSMLKGLLTQPVTAWPGLLARYHMDERSVASIEVE